jgi:hypothetical protein
LRITTIVGVAEIARICGHATINTWDGVEFEEAVKAAGRMFT